MTPSPPARDRLGSAWMIIAALIFALMGLLVKQAGSKGFGVDELVFWRTAFGALATGIPAFLHGKSFRTPHWRGHLNRSFSGTCGLLLFFYAVAHLPLATAVTLSYTSPLFLAALSFLLLKEKISKTLLLALLGGFAGIVILMRPTFAAGQETAALVGLCAGLVGGWAYLQVRELSQLGEPDWRVVFYFSLCAAVLTGSLSLHNGWKLPDSTDLPILLGIGLTATIAQICMTRAYRVGRKLTVAALSYLTIVFSGLISILLLGDRIDTQTAVGMAVITAAGILGAAGNRNKG